MDEQTFTVKIRRGEGFLAKPEAERIDGRTFTFRRGWKLEDDDSRYPGETVWLAPFSFNDPEYPPDAPGWIAEGDLVPVDPLK